MVTGFIQRRGILFQCVKLAAVNPGIGVGGAADPALDRFVIGQGIAISPEQSLARRLFELPLVGLGPALPKVALAAVNMESRDHPVAIERNVIAEARRELRIGLNTKKRAVKFRRNCALVN
ncbi:MAG TPA: hypothetical protein VNV13_15115 [Steroidobacteraceae bacterium]|nr:hypothetical protein [Steroidobacteraceae bacterium]